MKENKGITLVSLVVTIIVLIILAGVSINLTLGKNGIITKAKQAKENIELAKVEEETRLNELYTQIEAEGGVSGEVSYDAIAKLNEFKKSIANYIEEAGGVKPEYTANTTAFGESIKGILTQATKDATATAEDIAKGKTAYVNGELITGTLNIPREIITDNSWKNVGNSTSLTVEEGCYYILMQNVSSDMNDAILVNGAELINRGIDNYMGRKAIVEIVKTTNTVISFNNQWAFYYKLT